MQKLPTVCTCGDRLREHRADIETCEICECEKFTPEAALEKLRAHFQGGHQFDYDFQHDAVFYVTALEHRLVQVTAIAQINIEAGRECKAELAAATKDRDKCLVDLKVQGGKLATALTNRDALAKLLNKAQREIEVLRLYGNKDCTAMADKCLESETGEKDAD